jgi:hypothetical protein
MTFVNAMYIISQGGKVTREAWNKHNSHHIKANRSGEIVAVQNK